MQHELQAFTAVEGKAGRQEEDDEEEEDRQSSSEDELVEVVHMQNVQRRGSRGRVFAFFSR